MGNYIEDDRNLEKSIEELELFQIAKIAYPNQKEIIEEVENNTENFRELEKFENYEKSVFYFALRNIIHTIPVREPTIDYWRNNDKTLENIEQIRKNINNKREEILLNLGYSSEMINDSYEVSQDIRTERDMNIQTPMEESLNAYHMTTDEKIIFRSALLSVKPPFHFEGSEPFANPQGELTIQQAYEELMQDEKLTHLYEEDLEEGYDSLTNQHGMDPEKMTLTEFYMPFIWEEISNSSD